MSIVVYRLVLSSDIAQQANQRQLVRVVSPINEFDYAERFHPAPQGCSEYEIELEQDKTVAMYCGSVELDASGEPVPGTERWADPIAVTATLHPGKPVVTANGRLYWVAISKEPTLPQPDLVVAAELEPAQRLDDCDEVRPAICGDVAAEAEAEAEVAIATETESAELPVNDDLDGVIATSPDDDDEYEDVELMLGEEFAKLTLADKRAYIRSIDMAARIDMRSNASMLADYEKLLAE